MKSFWTFVQNMTLFNWLTVIAFIFFPLSALNAFLGLRSRYLDWRSMRSLSKFNSRLEELKDEWRDIQKYNKNLPHFFLQLFEESITPIIALFASLGSLIGAFAIYRLQLPGFRILEFIYLALGFYLTIYGTKGIGKAGRLVKAVHRPDSFVRETIDFIGDGKRKRFLPVGQNDFVDSLIYNDFFDEETRVMLQACWGKDEVKTIDKLYTKL